MADSDTREQRDRVRQRFTRTAKQFATFSLSVRAAEAERLVRLAAPRAADHALDVACGPGTFTRAFAPHVEFIYGLDLTPAFLEQSRQAAAQAGLANVAFLSGDSAALPFSDDALDLAICAYSFHHFSDARPAVAELARVVRRPSTSLRTSGGRVAVVDLVVPHPAQREVHIQIERARDSSHTCTLTADVLASLLVQAGLRLVGSETAERVRSFNDWMQIAGWGPRDPAYAETRRLMEATFAGDNAGFHARPAGDDIEFIQTSFFAVAEKL